MTHRRRCPSEGRRAETAGGQQTGGSSDGTRGCAAQVAHLDAPGTAAVEETLRRAWHREDDAAHEPGSPEQSGRPRKASGLRNPPEQKGMATSPDLFENAMNPMAGRRLQHTCTPEPEQTLRAEQYRAGGTRFRPAATERSFTAAEADAPSSRHRFRPGFRWMDWPRTGPMLRQRRRASARSARPRAGVDGSGTREHRSNPGFS